MRKLKTIALTILFSLLAILLSMELANLLEQALTKADP